MSLFPEGEGFEYEIRRSDLFDTTTEKPEASYYERSELAAARHALLDKLTHLPFNLTVDKLVEVNLSRPNSLRLATEQEGGGRRYMIHASLEYFPEPNRHAILTWCQVIEGTMLAHLVSDPTQVDADDLLGGIETAIDLLVHNLVEHDEFFRGRYRP